MMEMTEHAMFNLGFNHAMNGMYNPNMYRVNAMYRAGVNRAMDFKKELNTDTSRLKPLPRENSSPGPDDRKG